MKSQFRCLWFSLVFPMFFACSADDRVAPAEKSPSTVTVAAMDAGFVDEVVAPAPLEEKPRRVIEVVEVEAMPAKYSERMTLGKALVAKGNHVRARELFEAAAQLDNKQAEPYVELARSYIATSDRSLAMKAANKAVKMAPSSSAAFNTLGRAELLRHGYDNAIAAFTKATELDPENAWAWNNLGYTHLQLKQYEQAVFALSEATAQPQATGYMWNNLGLAYEQLDELDNARFAFEKGGKLGSKEAAASRRRLEGVETIIVDKKPDADDAKAETSYIGHEDDPEEVADDSVAEIEEQVELEENSVDVEVKVEAVTVEPESKTMQEHVADDAKQKVVPAPVDPPKPI